MNNDSFAASNSSDGQNTSPVDIHDGPKAKRPYRTPTIECYGSVNGMTQNVLTGSYKGPDTLSIYSY